MIKNIIKCPNPFQYEYWNNCLINYISYAPIETVEDTLCVKCFNRKINQLDNFLPAKKENLEIGSRIKCITPIFDLKLNEIYICSDFGFGTVIVNEKNYSKKRFEVWNKPFSGKGSWKEIISLNRRGLEEMIAC